MPTQPKTGGPVMDDVEAAEALILTAGRWLKRLAKWVGAILAALLVFLLFQIGG